MSKFIGIVGIMADGRHLSFKWSPVFEADDETSAYDTLHELMDSNMSDEEQHTVANDLVINLDEPRKAHLIFDEPDVE